MSRRRFPLIPTVLTLVMIGALSLAVIGAVSPARPSAPSSAAIATSLPTRQLATLQSEPAQQPPTDALTATVAASQSPATLPPQDPTHTPFPPPTLALLLPTVTPEPPTPTPAPALFAPAGISAALGGIRHEWQTWNNCGPATLAMLLSYYGSPLDQAAIGSVLRLAADDKNVSPEEMADYARGQGYTARLLVNGNADLLRTLVSNGFPVLVETWHEAEPNDGLGHYRLATGYDDAAQQWLLYDAYDDSNLVSTGAYQGIRMSYARLEEWWKVFNRALLLVYPPAQEAVIAAILDQHMGDPQQMWQAAALRAEAETQAAPDAFAWFNLGSSLTSLGRFDEAARAFDQARSLGLPWRMLWYQFAPFEAYLAVGRTQDVLALSDAVIADTASIEEIYYWRGRGLAALGDEVGAQAAYRQALILNPAYAPALAAAAE